MSPQLRFLAAACRCSPAAAMSAQRAAELTLVLLSLAIAGSCVWRPHDNAPLPVDPSVAPSPAGGPRSEAVPPSPVPVPPNVSHVLAIVRKISPWSPGALRGVRPPIALDRTFYSLTLEIVASRAERPEVENLARPGGAIEAFSAEVPPETLLFQRIEATLTLTGDTRGVRWWIYDIRELP